MSLILKKDNRSVWKNNKSMKSENTNIFSISEIPNQYILIIELIEQYNEVSSKIYITIFEYMTNLVTLFWQCG